MFSLKIAYFIVLTDFLLTSTSGQTTQKINVLFVNEEGNLVAEKAIDVAVSYIKKKNNLGVNANLIKVTGNRTDASELLHSLCSNYNRMLANSLFPHLVLDTTMTGPASETVKSFTATMALPTISASFGQESYLRQLSNIDENEKQYLIQIQPPADIILEIVRAIAIKQEITNNAAILFDKTFVLDDKYNFLLQNVATRHVIAPIKEADKIEDQLRQLRKLDIFNFFILGSFENIKRVLDAADRNGYFNRKYAWYAITQDKGDLKCNCKNATIVLAKPIINTKYQHRLGLIKSFYQLNAEPEIAAAFYFDLALHSFLAVKEMIADGVWKTNNASTFITCDDYDGKNRPKRMGLKLKKYFNKKTSETPTYGPINIVSNGFSFMDFDMQLTAVEVRKNSSERSVNLGSWKAEYDSNLSLINSDSMENYKAVVIYRIVAVEQKPFIIKDETAPKGYKGYCIDLIDKIAKKIRFDYEIKPAPDNKFGDIDKNGNWNGVVKELMEKRADIGLGSMSVTPERESVIDFTIPYYNDVGITILMKVHKASTSLFKFLIVLDYEVWLCILGIYFFASFLLWIFERLSPYSYQNNKEKYKDDEEKREFNLRECFWFCMTSLTPQGGGEVPKNWSGCLVAAIWWLLGFILIATYTANLAAYLTVQDLEIPAESLDDLSKQYKIQYAPLNGSSAMMYFERRANIERTFYEIWKDMSLNDSLPEVERAKLAVWEYPLSDKYIKIWEAIKEAGLPNTLEEAVERVRNSKSSSEGFAYIGDATDIKYLQLTNCDLRMVGEEFSKKPYAIAVQRGSPLKYMFNVAIYVLLHEHELDDLKTKWWSDNPEKKQCEKLDDELQGIGIENVGGVFILVLTGTVLAFIVAAFDYWRYKYQKRSNIVNVQEAPINNE